MSSSALPLKIDNLPRLTGSANYPAWRDTMEILLKCINAFDICKGTDILSTDSKDEEVKEYFKRSNQATLLMMQLVDASLVPIIATHKTPSAIWKALGDKFYRDNSTTFLSQLKTTFNLRYDESTPLSEYLTLFDTTWTRLQQRCANANETDKRKTPYYLKGLMSDEQSKADFLLLSLPRSFDNIVDNLTTKDNLNYSDVYERLLATSNAETIETAYKTETPSKSYKKANPRKDKPSECTWCKSRGFNPNGHIWSKCHKLKAHKEDKGKGKADQKANVAKEKANTPPADTALMVRPTPSPTYLDTAATSHINNSKLDYKSLRPHMGSVKGLGGKDTKIEGTGTALLSVSLPDGSTNLLSLSNSLFIPDAEENLISWPVLDDLGFRITGGGKKEKGLLFILKDDTLVFMAKKDKSKLFKVITAPTELSAYVTKGPTLSYHFWHCALGHPSTQALSKRQLYHDGNLIPSTPKNYHCEPCKLAKSTHSVPKLVYTRATQPFELFHSDLSGIISTPSFGGGKYFISFINDTPPVYWIAILKTKDQAIDATIHFITEQERQTGLTVKRWRTDGGGEFVNKRLSTFLKTKGIVHEVTPPYSHESNGVAERFNRTIMTMARAMLVGLDKRLWAEAVHTAVYIKNRLPHSRLKDQTPYEAYNGRKPTISHLQPFGRECYVHIPVEKRPPGSKLLPRAEKAIFVGYTSSTKIYRVFLTGSKRVIESREVSFAPDESEGVQRTSNPEPQLNPPSTTSLLLPGGPSKTTTYTQPQAQSQASNFSNSFRNSHFPDFLDDDEFPPTPETRQSNQFNIPVPPLPENPQEYRRYPSPAYRSPFFSPTNTVYNRNYELMDGNLHPAALNEIDNRAQQLALIPDTPSPIPSPPPTQPQIEFTSRFGRPLIAPSAWWQVQERIQESDSDSDNDDQVLVAKLDNDEPGTYKQAVKGEDRERWVIAMDEEIDALKRNDTWDVVKIPDGRKIVDSKWVYKVKKDADGNIDRYKARVVAKGFSQIPGEDFDEIFAPVVRYDSLRLLIAISAHYKWKPRQLDIKAAFLYGLLKEEIYMRLPEGIRQDGMCAKLKRCIYGLKQSPREWNNRMTNYLFQLGFVPTTFDPCVLIHKKELLFISLYVDDTAIYGPDNSLMKETIDGLKREFQVSDMGNLNWLLGIQIEYTKSGINLSQTAYIDKILKRFDMTECNPLSTPLDSNIKLRKGTPEDAIDNISLYQQIIGSLMYCVTGTRPDLAYTVTFLSQYSSCPNKNHLGAAKRVLRYLKGTSSWKLHYPWNNPLTLETYTDADYGNDPDDRISWSGYISKLGNATISWRSRKQRSVSTSTTESEYMALCTGVKHHIWLQSGLKALRHPKIPNAVLTDNNGAKDIAENPKLNDRSKHIDIQYHFTRQQVQLGNIILIHTPGKGNPADICTKPLPRVAHEELSLALRGDK